MKKTTIGLIVGGSALLLIFIAFLFYKTRMMIARAIVGQNQKPPLDITQDWQSQEIQFNVIAEATNSFSASNKIGEGGFGSVYKGRLLNGVKIAVKRLTPEGVQSFDNEIRLIGLVQHINIVRLLGFFSSVNEKILVYEYLENSGLDIYIFCFEIISGKKSRRFAAGNEGESLLTYVWRKWHGGNGMEIVDPFIRTSPESRPQQILRFVQIGLLCVQLQAEDRPTMSTVVFMLGKETVDIELPNSPNDTGPSSTVNVDESQTTVCQISTSILNAR